MTALDAAALVQPDIDEKLSTEAFDQYYGFAGRTRARPHEHGAGRKFMQDSSDDQRGDCSTSRIRIQTRALTSPGIQQRHIEGKRIIWRVGAGRVRASKLRADARPI